MNFSAFPDRAEIDLGDWSTVLAEVGRQFHQTREVNPFFLHRLKKALEAGRSRHPLEASCALGKLAALEGHAGLVRSLFLSAINLAPSHPQPHLDYALALRKLGCYHEARLRHEIAHERDQTHGDAFHQYLKGTLLCGRFQQARTLYTQGIGRFPLYRTLGHFLQTAASLIEQVGVSDEHLDAMQQSALEWLLRQGLRPLGVMKTPAVRMLFHHPHPDEGNASVPAHAIILRWGLQVSRDETTVQNLNQGLSREVLPEFIPHLGGVVHFQFLTWGEWPPHPAGFHC
ncbi:MAG: hypothetical protein H7831_01765 [Magnetococcus sp. WYHC-3]